MTLLLTGLLVLVCGAFYEASCVGFVHFSERTRPSTTALMSMLGAAAEVTGIFGSVHDLRVAPFFVLGIGVGAFLGVVLKRRASA